MESRVNGSHGRNYPVVPSLGISPPSEFSRTTFDFAVPNRIRRHDHFHQPTYPLTTSLTNTANMPGVSVRDVEADKFINAYAAFLKRQGKLPIPGP